MCHCPNSNGQDCPFIIYVPVIVKINHSGQKKKVNEALLQFVFIWFCFLRHCGLWNPFSEPRKAVNINIYIQRCAVHLHFFPLRNCFWHFIAFSFIVLHLHCYFPFFKIIILQTWLSIALLKVSNPLNVFFFIFQIKLFSSFGPCKF